MLKAMKVSAAVTPAAYRRTASVSDSGAPAKEWTVLHVGDKVSIEGGPQVEFAQQEPLAGVADFVSWGMKKYPSSKTVVSVSGKVEASELRRALETAEKETGRKPDLLLVDSPLSGRFDQLYEVAERATFIAATPEKAEPGNFPVAALVQSLNKNPNLSAEAALRKAVARASFGQAKVMLSGSDLRRVQDAGPALKLLVRNLLADKVPPERIYTALIKAQPMDGTRLEEESFSARDLGQFLKNLAGDQQINSPRVRQAAAQAARAVDQALLSQHVPFERPRAAGTTGFSAYLPWKNPQKIEGEFATDTGWNQLMDYVFASGQAQTQTQAPESELPLAKSLGKSFLKGYKKYVSPYDSSACDYNPSCSQYAREAIEIHGLVEGTKMGFMRLVSCNGHAPDPNDQVPGSHHHHHHHQPLPEVTLQPPPVVEKSALRRGAESLLFGTAKVAGAALGGLVGGVVGLATGVALGARVGYQAGAGTHDEFQQQLTEHYGEHKAQSFAKLVKPLTWVGSKVSGLVGEHLVSGLVGGLAGAVLGGLGGAYQTGKWVGQMGGQYAKHMTMDAAGELPSHYLTEQILQRDYSDV